MAFNNIPPNGFPALLDVEDLEAVKKDVTTLKSSVIGLTQDVTDLTAQKANQITIAPFFNSETAYDIGDLVYYNGLTYRCTNEHEGEWDEDDFVGTTIANELYTLKSGLIDNSMVPVNTVTLGTIATNESQKTFTATKNGYVTVNSGNVGATNPTVTCSLYQIARNYGAATTVTIPAYTGVKFCTIPVKAGDLISVDISGHTVDAEVLQISYS